jgi:hypothetical protein
MFNFDVNALASQIGVGLDALKPAIEKAATKLGTSTDKLLEVGVKGMIATGISELVQAGLCIAGLVILGVLNYKTYRAYEKGRSKAKKEDDYDYGVGTFIVGVLSVIAGIFCTIYGFILLSDGIIKVLAPEYSLLLLLKQTVETVMAK